jgi:hypothetical protein
MRVTELHVYPIKSCAGISLTEATLDARGIRYDRNWMLVNSDGKQLTQRDDARLALIRTRLTDLTLTLRAPQMPEISIPFAQTGASREVTVWRSVCRATDQGNAIAEWISEYLGTPTRLVRIADNFARKLNPEFSRRPTDQTAFADGYPHLLISQASLAHLNSRLSNPLPMNRFRPNIVVEGCEAHEEDRWDDIKIGELGFDVVKPCGRCIVTTTDQETAVRGEEPLKTLATYRKSERFGIQFGQNLIHQTTGIIRLSDPVTVIKHKSLSRSHS